MLVAPICVLCGACVLTNGIDSDSACPQASGQRLCAGAHQGTGDGFHHLVGIELIVISICFVLKISLTRPTSSVRFAVAVKTRVTVCCVAQKYHRISVKIHCNTNVEILILFNVYKHKMCKLY